MSINVKPLHPHVGAELPKDAIWVVFEDVTAEDWYVGGTTVAELKKRARK